MEAVKLVTSQIWWETKSFWMSNDFRKPQHKSLETDLI